MGDREIEKNSHFRTFVRTRRSWFVIVFVITLFFTFKWANGRSDTAIEILGLTIIASLVITTVISLASAPVLWILTKNRKEDNSANNGRQLTGAP